MEIILASTSPRRKDLLSTIAHNFTCIPSNFDEKSLKSRISNPEELVKRLAESKANRVFAKVYNKNNSFSIISGDTLVSFKGKILGKPKDKNDAIRTLQSLQGNTNSIYTGTTVIIRKEHTIITETFCSKTDVYMNRMSYNEIINYVNSGEPLDKAGSYAIQGIGKKYISKINGDFNSAIGLDTYNLKRIFKKYTLL